MKGENILYETLYQSILTQLYSGVMRCGQSFPSQQELCRQYNAGITTVRRVIRMLEKGGYIQTAPGKRAVVLYDESDEAYVSALLQRRASILDVYGGLALMMPSLYAEGALRADTSRLHAVIRDLRRETDQFKVHMQAVRFFTELLRPYGNPVILDLQADMEHYARIPYLASSQLPDPLLTTPTSAEASLQNILQLTAREDIPALVRRLEQMYRDAAERAASYLDGLNRLYPAKGPAVTYQWSCGKGQVPLYTIVARSLYKRMSAGEFDACTYLPSVPTLMKTYAISKSTACNAVALLSDIGAVRVMNKKGIERRVDGALSPLRLELPVISEHLMLYLDTMQILAVCTYRLSYAAVSALNAQQAEALAVSWGDLRSCHSPCIVQKLLGFLRQYAPYHSLRTIIQQFDDILIWGHYLDRLKSLDAERENLEQEIARFFLSLCDALKQNDPERFAACFQAVFQTAYRVCRTYLLHSADSFGQLPSEIM